MCVVCERERERLGEGMLLEENLVTMHSNVLLKYSSVQLFLSLQVCQIYNFGVKFFVTFLSIKWS